jgi:hypothetical protein
MKLVKVGLYTKPAATVKATTKSSSPKSATPTSKTAIRAAFRAAYDSVGEALIWRGSAKSRNAQASGLRRSLFFPAIVALGVMS